MIVAFSLGNFGQDEVSCNTGTFVNEQTTSSSSNGQAEINLACSYGVLNKITEFGQISINDKVNCLDVLSSLEQNSEVPALFYPSKCEWNEWDEPENHYINLQFAEQCHGQESCTFQFQKSDLPAEKCTVG